MLHDVPLIAILAIGLALAFFLGFLAARLRLPPLIGYLVAGIAVGPHTPGFVGDMSLASQLAEIGVILLMFGVGMHFSVRDLMAVRGIAIPGAIVQIAVAVVLGAAAATAWGWSLEAGIVFGLALSVASTVVLLRALEQHAALTSLEGRIAVGWLIVEDLAMVVALVLLPVLAGGTGAQSSQALALARDIAVLLGKIALFFVVMHYVGVRFFPWLFAQVAGQGSRELVTLFVVTVALGIAYGSAVLLGVSFALGAFFAGVVINESQLSKRVAAEAVPLERRSASFRSSSQRWALLSACSSLRPEPDSRRCVALHHAQSPGVRDHPASGALRSSADAARGVPGETSAPAGRTGRSSRAAGSRGARWIRSRRARHRRSAGREGHSIRGRGIVARNKSFMSSSRARPAS
jgi:predicted Kef-type K+ transport protein